MDSSSRNIYKTARQTAGMTQERWAELIGVSADSVRLYESGRGLPSDEVVARMAEIAPMPVLGYWHLKHKSGIANDLLPDVAQVSLPQAVVKRITCGARGEATAAAAKAAGLHGAELRASYDGCSAAGTAAVAVIVRRGLAALKFIDLSGDLVDLILQIRNLVIDFGLLLSQVVNLLLKFGGDFFERVYLILEHTCFLPVNDTVCRDYKQVIGRFLEVTDCDEEL